MAVPGTIQALIAAFSFGILFNAASGALVIYVKGHGSAIYRDGLRLVLILFLLTTSLWALVEFLATLIEPSATSTCQVAVVFTSLFDQSGRAFIEQYLAWAIPKGDAKSVFSYIPQILVLGRFFVGIAFTAVTRTQFKPTCAPISSIRAVSITTIALDAVIIGFLLIQAFANGSAAKSPSITIRTRTVRLIVAGVAVWWGTSVTSLLGLDSLDLFYSTALPGIGLTILVGLVTILSQTLVVPRETPRRPDSPISREPRDLSSSDSTEYPPSRYEDLKEANTMSISAFATKTEVSRGIRRNEDGTFPQISKPVAVGTDMNGYPVQGQLFPATKSSDLAPALSAVPPIPESWGIIKSTSGRVKVASKPKAKAGKLAISNPILKEDENMQNPLNRIPTIGLAEAANNDRLRREKYVQRVPSLVAQRPAPRPPSPPTVPDTMTTEPPVTGELKRSESTRTGNTSSGISVEGNASSTATQLSPGADVLRRRSPRQPVPAPLVAPFKVIRPGEPIRIPIPRPVEQDQDVPQTKPEPVKTPLQRRPTTGLPSNPRAQTLKSLTKDVGNQRTQTVMFVNNIVYDNPDAVGDIIQGAGKVPQPPDSGDSVVNRPRPIPRKGDKDRQVFPAEISPTHQHRRSKSGGSIVSRKSILQSVPGSPTGLPSLPPMPPLTRTLPNRARSMTVDEKMSRLYSAPLSAPSSTVASTKRRSSVPDLPPIPVAFKEPLQLPVDEIFDSESNNDMRASKASKRTTARTSSLLGITPDSKIGSQSNGLAGSSTNNNPVDELGDSWLPGIPFNARNGDLDKPGEVKRRSSPVLPVGRQLSMSTTHSEVRSVDEETMTNWGSVYSPVAPVSRQNARSTYIRKGPRHVPSSEEIPIIMFDESLGGPTGNGPTLDSQHRRSPITDSDRPQHLSGQFHHRLGDGCPTFSARKDNPRPRKMPPPTPLLLGGRSHNRAIIVQPAEPSPIESPRAAYEVIQAQLRKFEQLDRDSVESPARRLALLANLEQEMGQLESKWQSSHEHLGRDSVSSIRTLSRPSSQRSSVASAIAERRALRRARMQSGGGEGPLAWSSQNTSESFEDVQGASSQTRLAEAHAEYMENAPEFLVKRNNLNFVSVSKATLGSPSPPETDESDLDCEAEETHRTPELDNKQSTSPIRALWSKRVPCQEAAESSLWVPEINLPKERNQFYELPGLSIRMPSRKQLGQLEIESLSLWQNTSRPAKLGPHEGLWNNHPSRRLEAAKTSRRPVTIRPPRKNKRVTLLPDIIENPEPLPDRRDTLGIFQFPWGERSEHATLQYRPSQVFIPMPGTMTAGRPVANVMIDPRLSQSEETEYSSSFFDEYDDEGDDFSDFSGSGDDDFDETTLWEIASLLQTDQIPSKNSLLFMPSESSSLDIPMLTDHVTDIPSDDEHGQGIASGAPTPSRNVVAIDEQEVSRDVVRPLLWAPKRTSRDHIQSFGLPQLESWNVQFFEVVKRIKSRPLTDESERILSTKLWSPAVKETRISKASFLWIPSKNVNEPQETLDTITEMQAESQIPRLWTKSRATSESVAFGLPEPQAQIWQNLVNETGIAVRSKSRLESPLPSISSSKLWSRSKETDSVMLWTRPAVLPMLENNVLFGLNAPRVDYRTTPNPPAALSLRRRVSRRGNSRLGSLTSTSLWIPRDSASNIHSTTGLWKPKVDAPLTAQFAAVESSSIGLWKRAIEVPISASMGLFDPRASRRDFRRTSQPAAALSTVVKSRLVRGNVLALTSHNLWGSQLAQITVLENEKIGFLWQGKLSTSSGTPGLFRLDARRTNYRTTTADPAALVVIRRSRTYQQPLQRLKSNQLWTNGRATHAELNWITTCVLRPADPLSSSSTSSSTLRLSTDAAVEEAGNLTISTTTTTSNNKGGFFSSWFGRKTDKSSAITTVPRIQRTVTTSKLDVPELSQDLVIRNLDQIPHTKPTHTALRHRYRRTIAFNANWETALAEAIVTSYPGTIQALRASYPRDWDNQLNEAIIAGRIAPDVSRQRATPRDWSVALHQAIIESYPELRYSRGQALSSNWNTGLQGATLVGGGSDVLDYDVTMRHPAFFGALKTSAEAVHPALTGYRVEVIRAEFRTQHEDSPTNTLHPPNTPRLWIKPSRPQAVLRTDQRLNTRSDDIVYYPMRGNGTAGRSMSEITVDLEKQALWKRGNESGRLCHPSTLRKNWLEDSVNKRFTRIELRY